MSCDRSLVIMHDISTSTIQSARRAAIYLGHVKILFIRENWGLQIFLVLESKKSQFLSPFLLLVIGNMTAHMVPRWI